MEPLDGGVGNVLDLNDLGAVAKTVLDGVQNHQWGLVISTVILLLILSLRKFTPETSRFGIWIQSKLGAIISNFALSFGGAFVTMFAAGQHFTVSMFFRALTIALTASGGWAVFKNFNEAVAEKRAQAAGLEAAANPKDELNK